MATIKAATQADIPSLYAIANEMKAQHEAHYFERCMLEQDEGRRLIYVSESDGRAFGYVQLNLNPLYPPFRRLGIPEIQDLNVIPGFRRQGVGEALVAHCEAIARQRGSGEMGISVGLHGRFGAAQRLYVRLGYMPDGAGAAYDEVPVTMGELKPIDDMLTLKLTKKL
ncbi:MAG: GNAT family N-acetyltransferase [Alphaproteobacteria bacterium]